MQIDVVHRQTDPGSRPPLVVGEIRVANADYGVIGARVIGTELALYATVEDSGALGRLCLRVLNGLDVGLPPLTKAEALPLLLGSYDACVSALNARDEAWTVEVCKGIRQPSEASRGEAATEDAGTAGASTSDDGGCNVTSSSPESVAVLLAVLASLAARRSVRRRGAS